jgi:endonuclease/exonuclease/phosphatase family metal-dependent hydrolase
MATTFKVMTWNVENLFRPGQDAGPEAEPTYRAKLDLLQGTIEHLEPDVIAFQEIGGEEAFQDLQQALGAEFPHRRLSAFEDGRGIRVGFIARHAIDEAEDVVDFPPGPAFQINDIDQQGNARPLTRMGRGALRVRMRKDGFAVHLVTAHLKSKLLTYPSRPDRPRFKPRDEQERAQVAAIALLRRTAEAATLRIYANRFLEGNNGTRLIVLGDLNDVPDAATSQILNGPSGSEIKAPGSGFDRPDGGDDARLFNLAPLIENDRFSRVFRGRGELLDQILVSEELLPRQDNGKRKLPLEVMSHVDFAQGLASIEEDPRPRRGKVAPDHAPVTATFEL